jgi:REP element-mobilizing transposase RayT
MVYYQRHLPHIHPQQAIFFVTFRLVNSLPQWIIETLQDEFEIDMLMKNARQEKGDTLKEEPYRKYFKQFDTFLDAQREGNRWLQQPEIASIIAEAIHFRDREKYDLICYCIMPNHVHMMIEISDKHHAVDVIGMSYLTRVLQSLKSFTARASNKVLHRNGQFWQRESYDHIVRDDQEMERMIRYVIFNPVAAGFVKDWKDWSFTYCKYDIL